MTTNVNSKVLSVLDPHRVSSVMTGSRTLTGGYPVPGQQVLTVTSAMNRDCFVDDNTWRLIADNGEFDDIVIGSGFCALGYIDEALRLNPFRKILLLERGGFWLPDHFQNLPLPFQFVQQDVSETFPWELTSETAKNKIYLSGSSPFFGGRSSFWSIWSPRAIYERTADDDANEDEDCDLMDGFPEFMKEIAKKPDFYKGADRLLNVQRADKIKDQVFDSVLQRRFDHYLAQDVAQDPAERTITGVESAKPARLATGVPVGRPTTGFRQFSAVGSLLSINERQNKLARRNPPAGNPLMIATNVVVERFELEPANNPTHARVLHTSRGPLTLRGGKTNVILATGAIPATTILLNSIKKIRPRAGQHQGALQAQPNLARRGSSTPSRLRRRWSNSTTVPGHIRLPWINLSAEEKAQRSSRLFTSLAPDNGDTLTPEQLENNEGYVFVACSILGEQPKDTQSKVELNKSDPDVTTNIRLHLDLPEDSAMKIWETMEESGFQAIEVIAAGKAGELEYWNREDGKWESKRHVNRVKALFHEASTTFMTKDFSAQQPAQGEQNVSAEKADIGMASVDETYRPYGLENGNVYVTGAGLFPTAGSWNPTPTIVGFAQHLAKSLVVPPKRVGVFAQDQLVPATKTLGRPYIIGFKVDGSVSFWSFSSDEFPSPADLADTPAYRNDKHIRLLADTTGDGFYDLVAFTDTDVRVAIRNKNENTFNNFVEKLQDFTYDAGWRVDKHIRYMADVRRTGRADIIGFGDAGVFLSKNEPNPHGAGFIFTDPSIILDDFCYSKGWRLDKHLRFLGDFYGQGVPDIIGFGENTVFVAKNNGDGTFEGPQEVQGLDQFTFSSGWRVNKHVRTLANVTSKRRIDIVGFGDKGVYVAVNKGNGTVEPAKLVLEDFGYDSWRVEKHLRFVVDVDGDGLGDIVGFGQDGVYVSKNRGNGTFEEAKLVSRDFGYEQGWRVHEHPRFMADVTGNGCADIVGFKDKAAYVAFNDGAGNFGHAQLLTDEFSGEGWDPSTSVRYVRRLY
ncbi:hypothetical protein M413DRAFT_432890 [Hebeloma cylindrosporum]|uniref:Uncharacterized protein n=1 Tax=Hebeloma cylindrosporum TaxID=76867 RepID=A0A0C3BE51_HEBCY|nr:hypothetical protein M413DRAFT_432890 [Hebeloma cylindrosporum h7]